MAAADPTNPQSWNRYAYFMNNPLAMVDPLGLSCDDPHDGTPCIVYVSACAPGQIYWRGMCVNVSNVTGGNGCYVITEYGGGIGGVQCPDLQSPSQNNNCPPGVNCGSGQGGGSGQAGNAPDNGPHYSMEDICNASALLNKGGATALDLLGAIPGENTVLKGAQFFGGLISAGLTIFGNSSPSDAVFTGVGASITAVDFRKVMTLAKKLFQSLETLFLE